MSLYGQENEDELEQMRQMDLLSQADANNEVDQLNYNDVGMQGIQDRFNALSGEFDLKGYLLQKYNPEGMASARKFGSDTRLAANLGKAFNKISSSLGTPGQQVDNQFYDKMYSDAGAPMVEEQENQKQDAIRKKLLLEHLSKKDESIAKKLKETQDAAREKEKFDFDRYKFAEEQALKKRQMEQETAKKAIEKEKDTAQLSTPMGTASTADDAKKAKDFSSTYDSYTSKIDELMKLRQEYGGELYGPVAARMKNLQSELNIDFKNMAALGALSGPDLGLIEDAIGDVTSHLTSTESVLSKLRSARENADVKLGAFAKAYGLNPSGVLKVNPITQQEKDSAIRLARIRDLKNKQGQEKLDRMR